VGLARAAEAQPTRPLVLVLAERAQPGSIHTDAFLLALSVQLGPYNMGCREETWTLPKAVAEQMRLARERGARAGAVAAVWFTEPAPPAQITIQVMDLRRPQALLHTITMGESGPGIERSMAVAVRTLIRATVLELGGNVTASQPAPPASRTVLPQLPSRPEGPPSPPLLHLGAGYSVDFFPVGGDFRHGPEASLSVRLWPRTEGRLIFGYGLPREGHDRQSQWSRSFYRTTFMVSASWPLARRWEVRGGIGLALGAVEAEARALDSGRVDRARLWEVSLDAVGGAGLKLGHRIVLELGAHLGWLPLGHSLSVRGTEVAGSGELQVSLCTAVRVGFF
jgi:hypothetical protein